MQYFRLLRRIFPISVPLTAGVFLSLALAGFQPAWSQLSSATVTGLVRDASGANIPHANVKLQNLETNLTRTTVSNASGNYTLLEVPPGHYTLEFSAPHFQTEKVSAFELVVNQTLTLEGTLKIGEVDTAVTVSAEGAQIESSTAELGTVISEKPVNDLPLNGRNFTQLLTLTPGVTPVSVGQNASGSNSAVVEDSSFSFPSVNGQGNRENYFAVDGMNDQQGWYNTYAVAPIIDSIQEFKVNSHNDAQFGQVTGGVVNVVSKSGTNHFHGSAWEFLRNNFFDAKQYFQAAVTPFHQNQYGGTVGGPIWIPKLYNGRDKTFFFVGAEGYHHTKGSTSAAYLVPTVAERTGDYDDLYQRLGPIKGLLYDPHTGQPYPVVNGKHNQLQAELDPGAVAFVNAVVPAPIAIFGDTVHNAQTQGEDLETQWNYSGRIDQTIGTRDFVFFRYAGQEVDHNSPNALPSLLSSTQIPSQQYGASWVHIFNPTTSLQVLYGRSHVEDNTLSVFTKAGLVSAYGLDPSISSFIGGITQMANLNVASYFSGGENESPAPNLSNIHQYAASFSKTLNRHVLQAGGSWDQINYGEEIRNGTETFGATQTSGGTGANASPGDASASFYLGYPNGATRRNVNITERPGGIMSFYVQDSWKTTPRLTVNYGLRYDRTFIPAYGQPGTVGQNGGIETGDFNFRDGTYILQIAPPTCAVRGVAPCLPGTGALPAHVVLSPDTKILHDTKTNFGPRLGIAYRVNDKMAIRGSFGIFYDNWAAATQLTQNYQGSWPDVGTLSVANINPLGNVGQPITNYTSPHVPFGTGASTQPSATPFTGPVNFFVDPLTKNPYSEQYNVGIQQQFGKSVVLGLNYVGSESHRLDLGGYYNTGEPSPYPFNDAHRAAQIGPNGPQQNGQLYSYIIPDKWDHSGGNATYNAMQVSLNQRAAHGLDYLVSYTWSKTLDEGNSGYFGVEGFELQDPYNPRGSRGPAAYSIPQLISVAINYQIPLGKGKDFSTHNAIADYILGNWQVNTIYLGRSGQNFTINATGDTAHTGNGNTYARGLVVPGVNPRLPHPSKSAWFNTAAFVTPFSTYTASTGVINTDITGGIGNAPRDNMEDQVYHNVDLSIFRLFPVTEGIRIELRGEAFNVLNHTVLGTPVTTTNAAAGTFGTISGLQTGNAPRTLQLALKVMF